MREGEVPRLWPGETVVCIASGPSLTRDDVDYVRGKARVIVINTTYTLAPWADVLYACDAKWWKWHQGAPTFHGLKFSLQRAAKGYGVTVLHNAGVDGLERKPTGLKNGRNSGYQAINLAVHLGAARIILLGYDMQRAEDGRRHWHSEHPTPSAAPYRAFVQHFAQLVEPLRTLAIEVINCTRRTALTCFPRRPLTEVL